MKIVVFGLSISSAWGNGHATLLRGLFRALHERGHEVHFFERDTPYYASHRDASSFPFVNLHLYSEWDEVKSAAQREMSGADVGIVTSYCADGVAACQHVLEAGLPRTVFYDMDTPVTLNRLERGESVSYIPKEGLRDFDLVLSYTGGQACDQLRTKLGACTVAALYGWVDPANYYRVPKVEQFQADLSYLGTYSADRQSALEELLFAAARELKDEKFVIGGAMHPQLPCWPSNVRYFEHVSPPDHCSFYSSSSITLNVTRASMAAMGYCPSGRLFEAAACGTAVLSDWWEGLDTFFEPGEEILIAACTADSLRALLMEGDVIQRVANRARERVFDCHTADIRAARLIDLLERPVEHRRRPETLTVLRGA